MVVTRRACLAGCRTADVGAAACAGADDVLQHARELGCARLTDDVALLGVRLVDDLAVAVEDLDDDDGFHMDALIGKGAVGAREL